MFRVLLEAFRYYFAIKPGGRLFPPRDYLQWRLGTVYGSFDKSGNPRSVSDLCRDVWRDRKNVIAFLKWRRKMRLSKVG